MKHDPKLDEHIATPTVRAVIALIQCCRAESIRRSSSWAPNQVWVSEEAWDILLPGQDPLTSDLQLCGERIFCDINLSGIAAYVRLNK